jgi:hypothetical protein
LRAHAIDARLPALADLPAGVPCRPPEKIGRPSTRRGRMIFNISAQT